MPHIEGAVGAPVPAAALAALIRWLRTGAPPRPVGDAEAWALADAAERQGLTGLLRAAAGGDWPEPVALALRERHLAHGQRGARQLDVAARVHRVLLAEGVRSLPLKGAAVAEWLYDGPADRPMGDVDVLVLDGFEQALAALAAAGFVEVDRADHAIALADPSGVVVEAHRAAASCPALHPLDADGRWTRSRPGAGQVPRIPCGEDLLVLLATHAAFQHGLSLSLVQYLDLDRVLGRGLDPARALAAAEAAQAAPAVALALAAVDVLFARHADTALARAFAAWLPRGLGAWMEARRREPERLLEATTKDLARVRWALARGRRRTLLSATLRGHEGRVEDTFGRRCLALVQRTSRLARAALTS